MPVSIFASGLRPARFADSWVTIHPITAAIVVAATIPIFVRALFPFIETLAFYVNPTRCARHTHARPRNCVQIHMFLTWQMIGELFVLAIPIACVARTVVFEEVFRE